MAVAQGDRLQTWPVPVRIATSGEIIKSTEKMIAYKFNERYWTVVRLAHSAFAARDSTNLSIMVR
jgi:hypothetical protein